MEKVKTKIYERNVWAELGDVSFANKALYLLMWDRADRIGVVRWNTDEFRGLAGHEFRTSDLAPLGNRVVPLGDNEFLLSRYLKVMVGSLSRGSSGQKNTWDALHERWGKTRPDGTEPWLEEWRELKISRFAPDIVEEYHGEGPPPPWLKEHWESAQEATPKGFMPAAWNEILKNDVIYYCEKRVEAAMKCRTKKGTKDTKWDVGSVKYLIVKIKGWLKQGCTQNQVSACISSANFSNNANIFTPKAFSQIKDSQNDDTATSSRKG